MVQDNQVSPTNPEVTVSYRACSPGKFTTAQGLCQDCSPGKHSKVEGSSYCPNCAAGRHAPGDGSTVCVDCHPGMFSPSGSAACNPCETGAYSSAEGAKACIPCPEGKYGNVTEGAIGCAACSPGFFSSGGTTACAFCASAHVLAAAGLAECERCEAGFFANQKRTECLPCPAACGGGATCTDGILRPADGFWTPAVHTRDSAPFTDSTPIAECPIHFPDDAPPAVACVANTSTAVTPPFGVLWHARGGASQHRGLGRRLLAAARARASGLPGLAVISAVGTRDYYRQNGFRDGVLYQHDRRG